MNIRNAVVGLVLLAVVGSVGYLAYRYLVLPNHVCDICGRAVHAEHESTVSLQDGTQIRTCCPRCALHYAVQKAGLVRQVLVADYATAKDIEASNAIYLEGSDKHTCPPVTETIPREPGVEYDRIFDRCLPSLVAFREESAARAFQKQNGGRLLTYEQAVESVKRR